MAVKKLRKRLNCSPESYCEECPVLTERGILESRVLDSAIPGEWTQPDAVSQDRGNGMNAATCFFYRAVKWVG